jgi:hypothetical protein
VLTFPVHPDPEATLPPDVKALLVSLAVAVQRHIIYPDGHPSIAPAVAALAGRAASTLAEHREIAMGVADERLVVNGAATDHQQAAVRALAQRMNRHHVGAIVLSAGIAAWEVDGLIAALAADPDRADTRLGSRPPSELPVWPHVQLTMAQFAHLQRVDVEDTVSSVDTKALWLDLASAALSRSLDGADASAGEPFTLARAISADADAATRAAVFGVFTRIGEAVRHGASPDIAELRAQTSRLLTEIDEDALRGLFEAGETAMRRGLVLDAVHRLTGAAAVKMFFAAVQATGHEPPAALRSLLAKLADAAESPLERVRAQAHGSLGQYLSAGADTWIVERRDAGRVRPFPSRNRSRQSDDGKLWGRDLEAAPVVMMSVEMGVGCEALGNAADALVEAGQLEILFDAATGGPVSSATAALWRRLVTPETVRQLLDGPHVDVRNFDRLVPHLRGASLEAVFDSLCNSDNRAIRRMLLDRLPRLGPAVGRIAVRRAEDPRWFVTRNMLMLLGELDELPAQFHATPYLRHPDSRVRREALRLAARLPDQWQEAMTTALTTERDPRVLWYALSLLRRSCPAWAADPLIRLVRDANRAEDVRIAAVRVLGRCHEPAALDVLLDLCTERVDSSGSDPRTSHEALRALAAAWPDEYRARIDGHTLRRTREKRSDTPSSILRFS